MRKVSDKDKLFFFGRHFFTLDGLWMIETENEIGFARALKIDLAVWVRLLKKVIRRIKRHLDLEENSIENLIRILSFRWTVEGWDFDLLDDGTLRINKCPYNEIMKRNPKRHDKIIPICRDMCIPFYKEVLKQYNPEITLKREYFQGLDDSPYCDFRFYKNGKKFEPSTKLIMNNLTQNDKLFYFESNFFTMDGLWIIEVENETDWQTALDIDIVVWQRLYKSIFRRVARYLDLQSNSIPDLVEIVSFCWSCEGYKYEILEKSEREAIIHITECPYEAAMRRNPDRHDKIKEICLEMCIPFYEPALQKFNPNIRLERRKFLGADDEVCDFHFTLEE
ncbi:MAG: DUF6125 family protein [Promethearchaeia archaeon]